MPNPHLPEIPPDFNLFQIPRKTSPQPQEPAAPPQPAPPQRAPQQPGPQQPAPPQQSPQPPYPHQQAHHQQQPGGYAPPGGRPDPQLKYWEQKVKEYAAENLKLHQQLDAIKKHRDQLMGVLSGQQQSNAGVEEVRAALEAESVNARQLEQQLAHLQQRVQEFNGRLAEKDREVAAVRQHSAMLEQQLTQSTAELTRLKAEVENQTADRAAALSDLQRELDVAQAATERTESALRDQTARAREAAANLADLRLKHNDLQRQWEDHRKSGSDLNKRNADLEQRLADRGDEILHLRAELDRRGSSYTDEFALRARLKEELRQEYNARVATEQEGAAALRRQNLEMQERLNKALTELDEVKRQSIDTASSEAAFLKQLHATQALADKAQGNYGKEAARANKLEKSFETLKLAKDEVQQKLAAERKETTKFKRRAEALEKRLTKKRGSAADFSDAGDMDLRVRDSVSALAKATADLEVERRKLESAALQSRLPSLDATRVGNAFVNSFRSQLRPSADNLMSSIRRLMESSLESGQRRLLEAALENALVIQAGLQESNLQSESGS